MATFYGFCRLTRSVCLLSSNLLPTDAKALGSVQPFGGLVVAGNVVVLELYFRTQDKLNNDCNQSNQQNPDTKSHHIRPCQPRTISLDETEQIIKKSLNLKIINFHYNLLFFSRLQIICWLTLSSNFHLSF